MPNTRYRRGSLNAADMALYSQQISQDNSQEVSYLKKNLIRAIQQDVTPRQRQLLLLYYGQGMNTREIGELLGLHPSSVSRTIQRGEQRLQRCLRYGAGRFLHTGEKS